jgi:hypothetical protein
MPGAAWEALIMEMSKLANYKSVSKRGNQLPKCLYEEVPCSSVAEYFTPENFG